MNKLLFVTIAVIMVLMTLFAVKADYDYELANEATSIGVTQNMWCDCSNGMIRELGGQTFIAPYTGNLTAIKIKVNSATGTNIMYMNLATVDNNHHPNISTNVGGRITNSFAPGWNTWNFTMPYPVIEGQEYAIFWSGNYVYTGTHTVFAFVSNGSAYSGGGELFYENIWVNEWTGGEPTARDFIMNLTYSGNLPITEIPEEEPERTSNSNKVFFVNQNLNLMKQEQLVCKDTDLFCKIHQFIMNIRRLMGLDK